MCRLSGILCAFLSLLLLAKFVARKAKISWLNRTLGKSHVPICVLFLVMAIIHTATALPILGIVSKRFIWTGIIALALSVVIVVSGFFIKNSPKGIVCHRIASCLYLLVLMMH